MLKDGVFTLSLADRIDELCDRHGGIRPAGRAIGVRPDYLSRLRSAKKSNPSDAVLRKLGLRKVVLYTRGKK